MKSHELRGRFAVVLSALLIFTGSNCAMQARAEQPGGADSQGGPRETVASVVAPEPVRPKLAPKPVVTTGDSSSQRILRAASQVRGARIMVSIKQRQLWLINNRDTLLVAPVAVGMGKDFEFNGKKFHFSTPTGRRKVLTKSESPVWTVPEWHYMERAANNDHDLYYLKAAEKYKLEDGTSIEVRGNDVGRVNQFGNFWAFEPGLEIMYDNKVFVPPVTTKQRRVPDALGPFKLDMGEGYLIHGTHPYNENSIGDAVSHGCVRMDNFDLERLYYMVEPG
ncbi:MAG: L,D-transpeptidase, partial [Longimicrobiales bacterium]